MNRHYDNFDDCLAAARKAPEKDLIGYSRLKDGGQRSIVSIQILQERADEKQRKLAEMKLRREEPHTLWAYWQKAHWDERLGILGFFGGLILVGFAASQIPWIRDLLLLAKDLKP